MINDWRKYKQLEVEQRQEQKKEMERLIKKLSMTCRSDLDLENDKEKQKELEDKIAGKVRDECSTGSSPWSQGARLHAGVQHQRS